MISIAEKLACAGFTGVDTLMERLPDDVQQAIADEPNMLNVPYLVKSALANLKVSIEEDE